MIVENVGAKKQGANKFQRTDAMLNLIEPMLGLDKTQGQTGHIRVQPGGMIFVTGNPRDTIRYPTVNDEGKVGPRYNWVQSTADPDIYLGYLKDKPVPVLASGTDVVVTPATLMGDGTLKGGV